ncbi:MAG: Uma2 family endonuclease [Planctomycetia bacterium]|nr:Uma2 family endonuclease [Planctomycetia bacterium]
MSAAVKFQRCTFDEYCARIKEHEKADLIDGVIYMASPENTDDNRLVKWLAVLLHLYVEQKVLGEIFLSRVAFQLDDTNAPEPDIAFVARQHAHRIKCGRVQGPPDLAMEIVSPDSVERDYGKKRSQYERFGVLEYWIVDEIERKVTLLRLGPKGKYREVRPKQGNLHSEVLPGFWLRPEWLWADGRPNTMQALREILNG